MNNFKSLIIALGLVATPVMAETTAPAAPAAPAAIKEGVVVFSAEGRRIGRIDRIKSAEGAPTAVSIIYNGRFIYIPVSTLTAGDRGLTSSLSKAELNKL